jgi:hypothetical protein
MAERYTAMEKLAIVAARTQLWDALVAIDGDAASPLCDAFCDLTGEQIDSIISTIWEGLRASMQIQSARGEIPF